MDNANEINQIQNETNLTHKEVALFLGDELKTQNTEQVITYDLAEEYAKTAKNKKKFVWILLASCFFVVGAATFTTIALVANSNHKITINIDSFADLNLRTLLNSLGRTQTLYDNAVKNKETLVQNRDDELRQAEQKKDMDLFTLESVASIATKDSVKERKAKIEADYKAAVEQIHAEYDEKIKSADEDVKNYGSKINEYDSAAVSKAKDAESSIDSTKQLHDMEMNYLQERYEKKIRVLREQLLAQQLQAAQEQREAVEEVRSIYQAKIDLLDPKAREQNSDQNKIILEAGIKNQLETSALWDSVDKLEFKANSFSSKVSSSSENFLQALQKTEKELSGLRTIASRFKPIPMENSIKDYVPAITHQSYQIAEILAKSGVKLQEEVNDFEVLIEKELSGNADAVILSVSKAPELKVYVAKSSRSKINEGNGTEVQILNENKPVADGTIFKKEDFYFVRQKRPAENGKVQPYTPLPGDKIRIILPQVR